MPEASHRPWNFMIHLILTALAMLGVLAIGFALILVGMMYLPVDLSWIVLLVSCVLMGAALHGLDLHFDRKYR